MIRIAQYVFIICFFIISKPAIAQTSNSTLIRHIENKIEALSDRIDLTQKEKHDLLLILTDFRMKQSKLSIFSENLDLDYKNIIDERDNKISKLLGKNKLKVFQLLEEIQMINIIQSSNEINSFMDENLELGDHLIKFRIKFILPQLSVISTDFSNKLSTSDLIKLKNIRSQFYNNLTFKESNGSNWSPLQQLDSESKNDFFNLLKKLEQFIIDNHKSVYNTKEAWDKAQYNIYQDYINENNINALQQDEKLMAEFRVNMQIFHFHLLMLIPYDRESYAENLNICITQKNRIKDMILSQNELINK